MPNQVLLMRGLQPNFKRLRELRLLAGFTQGELALRTGIAERTIRNAEAGRSIRHDFLDFIAQSLGVTIQDLIADRDELREANLEKANADSIVEMLAAFTEHRDLGPLRRLTSPTVRIHLLGPDSLPLSGEYRGIDGIRRLMEMDDDTFTFERPVDIREIRGAGKFVIMSGVDHLRIKATNKSFSACWYHTYQFDEGRLVRLDCLTDTAAWLAAITP